VPQGYCLFKQLAQSRSTESQMMARLPGFPMSVVAWSTYYDAAIGKWETRSSSPSAAEPYHYEEFSNPAARSQRSLPFHPLVALLQGLTANSHYY
jgi:hypothetical protein